MKIKDLEKYKVLDITEMSGSTWNEADLVLGLRENKDVIMAEATDYASEEYVDGAVAAEAQARQEADAAIQDEIDNLDLSDYAKTSAVTAAINTAMAAETARTENTYIKEHQSLDDYYTKSQTDANIATATDDMATETWVQSQGYLTEHQSLAGLFSRVAYVSSAKTICFWDKTNTLVGEVDATDFIKDGMVDDVYIDNGFLVISFNTEAGKQDIRIPLTSIFDPANYYTKAQVDSAITAATNDMATQTWVNNQGFLKEHQDLSAYAKTTAVTADINAAIASETARTESTYLKEHQDISGKLNVSDFNTYSAATATEIAGKQATLVSGTNIKTINNESLLGSGNIDIQGGGGNANVVELTKAEYDALTNPDSATTYIITDAEIIDLNDYASASGLTELSGTVSTLSTTVAGKADKANVTARAATAYYAPGWNAQGVITSETRYYRTGLNINGTSLGNVDKSSNTAIPAFYAPTAKGTAGQVLQSPASGNVPTWSTYKFAFLSQSDYDALATKDATTIYFITGD